MTWTHTRGTLQASESKQGCACAESGVKLQADAIVLMAASLGRVCVMHRLT